MKCRPTLLMLAFLLLIASLASAAPAAPAPAAPALAPVAASPFCAASLLQLKPPTDGIPAPTPVITQTCGVCSDSYCQGAVANSTCFFLTRFGYQQGRCALWLGDRCPEDNKWDCLCTNQPLP
ncbi:MAG TPA: hypothetical protein VF173_38825 [Thermoanaerobaculia bacterium]|nr:hypothetical protein [Thermoanaerobaculia bacterium]